MLQQVMDKLSVPAQEMPTLMVLMVRTWTPFLQSSHPMKVILFCNIGPSMAMTVSPLMRRYKAPVLLCWRISRQSMVRVKRWELLMHICSMSLRSEA
ncbi:hypothetical protein BRADI_3g11421v3 [Brachypodium distachyon]|uniref:Uncharacterized protein n=1 Tax=Brachypodium distachyon TaxID=15368 RepID=A0A0Q3F8L9_BRADI|nr:hypothetical protein BRADI_3g11421v3 [Brachypodium distachyon]